MGNDEPKCLIGKENSQKRPADSGIQFLAIGILPTFFLTLTEMCLQFKKKLFSPRKKMESVGVTFQVEMALGSWYVMLNLNKVLYMIVTEKSFQFPIHNSKKILPATLKIISDHGVP